MQMHSPEKTYLQTHLNDPILTTIFIEILTIKIARNGKNLQQEDSTKSSKLKQLKDNAQLLGYGIVAIVSAIFGGNRTFQPPIVRRLDPVEIATAYEQYIEVAMKQPTEKNDQPVEILTGDDFELQTGQLGPDTVETVQTDISEATETNTEKSRMSKQEKATSKGKSNKKRRAPRKYGKVMRLSNLPPLENDQFDLTEFDENIFEEGSREYRPSERKIGLRLPCSNTIILPRNN